MSPQRTADEGAIFGIGQPRAFRRASPSQPLFTEQRAGVRYYPDAPIQQAFIELDRETPQFDEWNQNNFPTRLLFQFLEQESIEESVSQEWDVKALGISAASLRVYKGTGERTIPLTVRFTAVGAIPEYSYQQSLIAEVKQKIDFIRALAYPTRDDSGETLPVPRCYLFMGRLFPMLQGFVTDPNITWEGPFDYNVSDGQGTMLPIVATANFTFAVSRGEDESVDTWPRSLDILAGRF